MGSKSVKITWSTQAIKKGTNNVRVRHCHVRLVSGFCKFMWKFRTRLFIYLFFFLSFVLESLLKYISFIEVAKLLSNYFFFFFFLEVNCWQIKWIKWFQYVIIKPFNGKLEGELKVMTTLPTLFKTVFCHLCYVWEISLIFFFFFFFWLRIFKCS